MENGWLICCMLLGGCVAIVALPRLYCALTHRCPWLPALLQRVQATLEHWTEVLAHDWAMLLGCIRAMSQNDGAET